MNQATPSPTERTMAERIRRVRQEPRRRHVQVLRVEELSPHMRSITFGGDDLAHFASHAFDDHVKIFLPVPEGSAAIARDYTPRRFDADKRELCIEFALHGDGPAARWARAAQPGDRLTVGGPRGSFILPDDLHWYLLVGDSSSLPAILRRLEELPVSAPVQAIVQMDASDQRALPQAAQGRLKWVSSAADCREAVQAWKPLSAEGFAWCAGEASEMRELRRLLVEDKGVDRQAVRAAAYWKRGTPSHHEMLEDAR
ncbi:MAG: siderophore-interacting protein [Hydrogenophaga sp.]